MTTPTAVEMAVVQDVEGACLVIGSRRVTGPKPWGGGFIAHEFRVPTEELMATIPAFKQVADALEQVKAALGDRLLGKGPLSEEYAHAVIRQINDALRAAGRLP